MYDTEDEKKQEDKEKIDKTNYHLNSEVTLHVLINKGMQLLYKLGHIWNEHFI